MRSASASRIRCAAAVLFAAMVCINCDCGGDGLATVGNAKFLFINGTNNLASARAEVRGGDGVNHPIPGNVAFGEISAQHTVGSTTQACVAAVEGVTANWQGRSELRPIGNMNLIVSSSIPGSNAVDLRSLPPSANPMIAILRDRGAPMDVYVTAPGANLATVQKDDTVSQLGVIQFMPQDVLHPNTAFQVRLTDAGTKNLVVDFGTQPAIPAGHFRVLLHIHSGNNPELRVFTIDAR